MLDYTCPKYIFFSFPPTTWFILILISFYNLIFSQMKKKSIE